MKLNDLKTLVNNGKFFSVEFTKKDGSLRKMTCRLGVKSYLKGGNKRYNAEDKNLLTVFDIQKKEYRQINMETLNKVKIKGNTITIKRLGNES